MKEAKKKEKIRLQHEHGITVSRIQMNTLNNPCNDHMQ